MIWKRSPDIFKFAHIVLDLFFFFVNLYVTFWVMCWLCVVWYLSLCFRNWPSDILYTERNCNWLFSHWAQRKMPWVNWTTTGLLVSNNNQSFVLTKKIKPDVCECSWLQMLFRTDGSSISEAPTNILLQCASANIIIVISKDGWMTSACLSINLSLMREEWMGACFTIWLW